MLRIFISFLICLHFVANTQDLRFTFKVFPSLNWSRTIPKEYINSNDEKINTSCNGLILRGGLGVQAEKYVLENLALGLGIQYLAMGSGFKIEGPQGVSNKVTVHYVQLPLFAKFLSNEVAERTKIFVQLGPSIDVLVGARLNGSATYQESSGQPYKYAREDMKWWNSTIHLSIGGEYEINGDTKAIFAISYRRGFINTIQNDRYQSIVPDFKVFHDVLALELGIKF